MIVVCGTILQQKTCKKKQIFTLYKYYVGRDFNSLSNLCYQDT